MAAVASPLDAALWLRQGAQGWELVSTRAEWAARAMRGRPGSDAARLLPALYSLCGGAHRLAAGHAVTAAQGAPATAGAALRSSEAAQALRLDSLREHLRRLWLDAPRWASVAKVSALPPAAAMARELAACPYLTPAAPVDLDEESLAAGRRWVERHVLGCDIGAWLAAWQADPAAAAARWANAAASASTPAAGPSAPWPAHWLAGVRRVLADQAQPVVALRVADDEAALRRIGAELRATPGFALAPTQAGHAAETGCWTRAADTHAWPQSGIGDVHAPLWMRHAARVAEVAHLASREGHRWLAQGALALDRGEGLGWCEMARGLLVHWVRLDGHGHIADYRVLAPTEWNFHPRGGAAAALTAAAQARQAMQARQPVPPVPAAPSAAGAAAAARVIAGGVGSLDIDFAQIAAIAAAYDPCVDLRVGDAEYSRLAAGGGAWDA